MADPLNQLRGEDGNIPTDKLAEAITIMEPTIKRMIEDLGGISPGDQLYLIETTTAAALGYLATLFADLANEVTEMWNFVGKMSGAKAHRNKKDATDIEAITLAFKFSKIMAVYNLLKQKGATDSGLVLPK